MTQDTPGHSRPVEPPQVTVATLDASRTFSALEATYGKAFALCVSHATAMLSLNSLLRDCLGRLQAEGHYSAADVAKLHRVIASQSADATSIVLEAFGQQRNTREILDTAGELRQRMVDGLDVPPNCDVI
jgi:hypothetical protein